jgi:tetratricopeptide (TPR) repeat protein
VLAIFDRYGRDWTAMHRASCEATRVRGEQSEQTLDLRMDCLADRRRALDAAAGVLAEGDAKALSNGIEVAASLPPLDACADVAALRARRTARPPPGQAARWEETLRSIARVRPLVRAGNYAAAVEEAQRARNEAAALGGRQLEAEALSAGTRALIPWARLAEAASWAQQATVAAQEAGDPLTEARAWVTICYVAIFQHEVPEGRQWSRLAGAALVRAGGSDEVEFDRLSCLRSIELYDERFEEALALARRALSLAEKQDPDGYFAAWSHGRIGVVLANMGHLPEGQAELEKSLQMQEHIFGPDHANLIDALFNLADALVSQGLASQAIPLLERGLRMAEAYRGPESAGLISTLGELGDALVAAGRPAEGLERHQHALRIAETAEGVSAFKRAEARADVGVNLVRLGRAREALPVLEQAEMEFDKSKATPLDAAECRLAEAQALASLHRDPARARALVEKARAAWSDHARKNRTALYAPELAAAEKLLSSLR